MSQKLNVQKIPSVVNHPRNGIINFKLPSPVALKGEMLDPPLTRNKTKKSLASNSDAEPKHKKLRREIHSPKIDVSSATIPHCISGSVQNGLGLNGVKSLKELAKDQLNDGCEIETQHAMRSIAESSRDSLNCYTTFMTDKRCFSPPNSDVRLEYSGSTSWILVTICVYLDSVQFQNTIGDSNCLIAPIVEVDKKSKSIEGNFKLSLPHSLTKAVGKDAWQSEVIKVQKSSGSKLFTPISHSTVRGESPLGKLEVQDTVYDADDKYIHIYTKEFSKFVCTGCPHECNDNPVLFLTGNLREVDLYNARADLKIFLCSPLYKVLDYRQALERDESGVGRTIWEYKHLDDLPGLAELYYRRSNLECWLECERGWEVRRPTPRNLQYRRDNARRTFWVSQAKPFLNVLPLSICNHGYQCHRVRNNAREEMMHVNLTKRTTPRTRLNFAGNINIDILIPNRGRQTQRVAWDCVNFEKTTDINTFQITEAFYPRRGYVGGNFHLTDEMYVQLTERAVTNFEDFFRLGHKLGLREYELKTIQTDHQAIQMANRELIFKWKDGKVGSEREKSNIFCCALKDIEKAGVVEEFLGYHHRLR